ncbi:putative oxalocrotonate tautomerase [Cadophora sp. MPI-SDFR-AT-0126]|nr:putative oxalocrotonate tautomerase [Leotiomycetes sp. MPI-SDFR-AT-0126]
MPLWLIYHPEGVFEDAKSKGPLSESITAIYTRLGLPAFYAVVIFVPVPTTNFWVGGKECHGTPFIRISVDQIAIRMNEKDYEAWTTRVDEALKPHIQDKGYDWEYHIGETERRLWKVNGLNAPPFGSESEKEWVAANRVLPWSENGVSEPPKTDL